MSALSSPSNSRARRLASAALPPLLVFAAVVLLWQALVVALDIKPFLVPSPMRVASAAWQKAPTLLIATGLTGLAALAGLLASLVVGGLSAFAFAQSRLIERGFYPYAIFLQTVPIVAVAPLIVIWFGNGFGSVVIASFIVSVFPIITNGTHGLKSVDRNLLELFAIHDAGRLDVLLKLRLPNSVPYFVTGLKVSSGLAVIGAIVGEFFVGISQGNAGLGYLITKWSGQLKTAELFAAIFASTLLGVIVFWSVDWLGDRLTARWRDE